mgnify:CR=1 FL=1
MATVTVNKNGKQVMKPLVNRASPKFWNQDKYRLFAEFYQKAESLQEVVEHFDLTEQEVSRRAAYLRKGGVALKTLGKTRVDFKAINESITN